MPRQNPWFSVTVQANDLHWRMLSDSEADINEIIAHVLNEIRKKTYSNLQNLVWKKKLIYFFATEL